jgi:hypothetical protein
MSTLKSKFLGTKVGFALAAGFTGAMAQAADHSVAIGAAGTDGETNTGAAVVVVLGIAAVVTGVGIVIKLLGR